MDSINTLTGIVQIFKIKLCRNNGKRDSHKNDNFHRFKPNGSGFGCKQKEGTKNLYITKFKFFLYNATKHPFSSRYTVHKFIPHLNCSDSMSNRVAVTDSDIVNIRCMWWVEPFG